MATQARVSFSRPQQTPSSAGHTGSYSTGAAAMMQKSLSAMAEIAGTVGARAVMKNTGPTAGHKA